MLSRPTPRPAGVRRLSALFLSSLPPLFLTCLNLYHGYFVNDPQMATSLLISLFIFFFLFVDEHETKDQKALFPALPGFLYTCGTPSQITVENAKGLQRRH